MTNGFGSLLERIARFSIERRRLVFSVSAALAIGSIALASRLELDADILNLVPAGNREVNEFRSVLQRLGTIDQHVIVIDVPKGQEAEAYAPLVDDLISRMARLPEVRVVEGRLPDPEALVKEMLPRALLFLRPDELESVATRLTDEALREQVSRNKLMLQTPQSTAMKRMIGYDPFGLLPLFLDRFRAPGAGLKIDASSGYFLAADHSTYVIVVKPKNPARDFSFAKSFLNRTSSEIASASALFRKANPSLPPPAIGETGGYAISLDDSRLIKRDVLLNVASSFVLVLLLFIYAFRRLTSLLYGGIPMALAITMTFAVAAVVFRILSPASAVFGALVAGLGIDFITVLYERYIDERNEGRGVEDSLAIVFRTTGPGVVVAAITTAGVFFAYLFNDFRGMSQLGFLVGTGVLLFFALILLLMPALIASFELGREHKKMKLHSFGSDRLITLALRSPRATIVIWMFVVGVFAIFALRIEFEGEITSFRAQGNAATELQNRVTKTFGQSFSTMMHVTEGKTIEEAVAVSHAAIPHMEDLVARGAIGSYQSIASIVPPLEQQRTVIETLRDDPKGRFSFDRIAATFRAALEEEGFRADAYDEVLESYRSMLAPTSPITFSELQKSVLGPFLERFVRTDGERALSVSYLYPKGTSWPREVPAPIMEWRERESGVVIVGTNLVSSTLKRIIQRDALISTSAGVGVVFVFFVVVYRSLTRALLMFVPLLCGSIIMIGAMALMGFAFNLVNVFVGLMLVGVATDYAVYMGQRFYDSPDEFRTSAPQTGKAIAMAAITSMLGFGSFVISHFPGMRSIGYASLLGIGFSFLASITLLPALLTVKRPRR